MTKNGLDYTERMRAYAEKRLASLITARLCGYILKKDSPSCGMERVRVYSPQGAAHRAWLGSLHRP